MQEEKEPLPRQPLGWAGKPDVSPNPPRSAAEIFGLLAGLDAGLQPEENTRTFFQKLLSRGAKLLGARRLLVFESRPAGQAPYLLAWYGVRPGQPEQTWNEIAKTVLQENKSFFPAADFYNSRELEIPKIPLTGTPIQAYGRVLGALVAALPQNPEPNLLYLFANQIGLHLANRRAGILAAGQQTRANFLQARLDEMTARFQTLFESKNQPETLYWDWGRRILQANPAAERLLNSFGLTPDQISLDDLKFFEQEKQTGIVGDPFLLKEQLQNFTAWKNVLLEKPEGDLAPLLIAIEPILGQNGQPNGSAFIFIRLSK
jgi:PAS domain-containing protein